MSNSDFDRLLEQRLREISVTNELIKTLTSELELPDVLRIVLDRMKILTQAEGLSLLLYDGERDELVFAATETLRENTLVGKRVPSNQGIATWVARTGQSAIVNNVAEDPRFYNAIDRESKFATQSILAVPVRREGQVIGVLEVINRYDGLAFSQQDRENLEGVAVDLGERMDAATINDQRLLGDLLNEVAAAVPSEASSLLLYDGNGEDLVFRASRTLHSGLIDGVRIRCDQGIAGWVARTRQAVRLDDVTKDPRYYPDIAAQTKFTPKTMLCVPMLSKGTLLGVVQVINKMNGGAFSDDELRIAQTLADHAAIAIENASLYRQAYAASITDDLTGLHNTRFFNRQLPLLIQQGRPLSLIILDLDNFKAVVDTYGHLIGSQAITYAGKVIKHLLRPGDIAARFGGDEFVVILPNTDAHTALGVAETIRAGIEAAETLDDREVDLSGVTASVGVATFPEHAGTAETLFRVADTAMYSVKRRGKNGVALAVVPRAQHSV